MAGYEVEQDVCEVTALHPAEVAAVRKQMKDERTINDLAESFQMLSDPTRLKIVLALSTRELCVCDLAALIGLSESAVSHQLRLLRSLRVVKYRREGKMAYYSLDDEHVFHLVNEGLRHVEEG